LLKDLYKHLVPLYTSEWKVIGKLLGISTEELTRIERENLHKNSQCCIAMLERWLEVDSSASWKKIFEVIEFAKMSSHGEGK